jgi:hypothetical protein
VNNPVAITNSAFRGKDRLWRGFVLNAGNLIFSSNCLVSGAYRAIEINSGALHSTGTTFQQNYISIYKASTAMSNLSTPTFKGNTFMGGTLLATSSAITTMPRVTTDAYVAIFLKNTNWAVNIAAAALLERNTIRGFEQGILAQNTNLTLQNTFIFSNITPLAPFRRRDYQGSAIYSTNGLLSVIYNDPTELSFSNCYRGIAAISNNSVTIDGANMEAINCGITASAIGMSVISIKNNTIGNDAATISAADANRRCRGNGIFLYNADFSSSYTINNNKITMNLVYDALNPAQTFGGGTAIYVGGNNMACSANIISNTIQLFDAAYGIYVDALTGTWIGQANKINSVFCKNAAKNIAGISLNGTNNVQLEKNHISGNITSTNSNSGMMVETESIAPCGIVLTGAVSTHFCSNELSNLYTGLLARDNCNGTELYLNQFSENHYSLFFTASLTMPLQGFSGNAWTGITTSNIAKHRGDDPFIGTSIGRLQGSFDGTMSPFLPTNLSLKPGIPTTKWILPNTGNESTQCLSSRALTTEGITEDEQTAEGADETSEFTEEMKKWTKATLYEKLKENPAYALNSLILENFRDSLDATIWADFYTIAKQKSVAANTGATALSSACTAYAAAENTWLQNATANDSTANAALQVAQTSYTTAIETARTAFKSRMYQLFLQNQNISNPNEIHAKNLKMVNELYLGLSQQDDFSIDSVQLSVLLQIALQCPVIGGPAVYQARALVASSMQLTYNDNASCAANGINFRTKPTDKTQVTAFALTPNPSNGIVTVKGESGAQLAIYNAFGQLLASEYLQSEKTVLPLSFLQSGCYFAKLTKPSGETAQQTFIISK